MPTVNLARERSLYKAFSEHALKSRQSELAKVSEQLATFRRVNRASDDASAYIQARQLEALGERYTQYERSIASARSWVDHTQDALDELSELFTQAYEEGVRFANATHSEEDRQAGATRLESILASVVDQLNARSGSEYLFAGSRTTVQPFVLDEATNTVTYQGNDGGRLRHVGRNVQLNINIPGDSAEPGKGVFTIDPTSAPPLTITGALAGLIDAVRGGDPAQLETALANIERARDHVTDRGTEAGNIGNRLQLAEEQLADAMLLTESRRSDVEDVDMLEALVRQQQAQTGLQAALHVTASVLQKTILDYLK